MKTGHREVMQTALDALYENTSYSINGDPLTYQDERNNDTIDALRAALAQPEPEPVAYWVKDAGVFTVKDPESGRPFAKEWEPLYTAPPQRKPLTNEEIEAISEASVTNCYFDTITFARAIETAHGIGSDHA